ncbi:ABC transporter ATP-binding protein [Francisella sp. 19X1-34]|uniref:ABC transporter ATP-binding protein n=1 Tax=Francisella sp. 19X1-34 TaxID=3087177 RepID=UPI002E35656E|nr:ABC transporter ATP-binding protein [Francisella sp. 19X1-34]MED7789175.1 ABC transporter ATP-binding protein [Francisella sp. 19X1-34]
MKKDIVIKLSNLSKNYKIYESARDRVKEAFSITRKKYYKDFCAVKNINLDIKKGEVLGIFGLNGAGKSTLLKMIAGVVTPSSGSVNVHGNINAMLELGGSINPELTGEQNIGFSLDLNKVAESERKNTIEDIIDFAEIGDYIRQPVKNYSSGMKARLGFGIATAVKPDILIVDEVLAVGDAIFQNKCFVRIRQLLKEGTTVIFVSHNVALMVEFCTRAIFIHNKEILLDGDPREVAHYYQKALFSPDKERVIKEIKRLNGDVDELDHDNLSTNNDFKDEENDISTNGICIYDSEGNQTSFLETGLEYTVSLDVNFKNDYKKVRVDFSAHDITGKTLSIFNSFSEDNILKDVKNSEKYNITNKFKCDIFKGQYAIEVNFVDIADDRFEDPLKTSKIEVKFEAGVISKETTIKIKKL